MSAVLHPCFKNGRLTSQKPGKSPNRVDQKPVEALVNEHLPGVLVRDVPKHDGGIIRLRQGQRGDHTQLIRRDLEGTI